MTAPTLRWCEAGGMVYRQVADGTWLVLDAVGVADPSAVADAESLIPASGPDPGFHRMLLRTGVPAVVVTVVVVAAVAALLAGVGVSPWHTLPGLIPAALPVGFVGWVGWIVWLASRSECWDDRWMA